VYIDRFFDLYQEWLVREALTHSPARFRQWIEHDYCPDECRCRLELPDPSSQRLHLFSTVPTALHVRCHNTSIKAWQLHPSTNAGVHLYYVLCNDRGQRVAEGKAGLFYTTVAPGAFIDLTVILPGIVHPGEYELRLDMEDEQHAYFLQTGSEPLICRLEVP
jgi:hypothetical protein